MPALDKDAARDGFALEHRASIGSTSANLMARARGGEIGPLWLVADEQTEGRGRRARHWGSPPGNLYASLLLSDPAPAETATQLSLVFALALRDAVVSFARPQAARAEIKWPNDLMLGGRKAAGLLLEGGSAGARRFVVAGFGVNILSHPDGTTHPATHLEAEGYPASRDALFERLSGAVRARLAEWDRGRGIATIRAAWMVAAYGLGRPMRIATAAESYEAIPLGLDEAGRLVVERDGREIIVSAGEVFELDSALEVAR